MAEEWQKRVLPHNIDAERSVLGSILLDREAIMTASEIVLPEDFYVKQHEVLFQAMLELNSEGKPIDLITLQSRLKEKDLPPEMSGLEYIREIVDSVPTSANIKYYATIVAEQATLRKLIKVTEDVENSCYVQKEPMDAILDKTEKEIFKVVQKRNAGDFVPISVVVNNALDKISTAARNKGAVTGVPTGFIDLDYMTAGMQPSDLVIIAARPAMGKTAFALNIAANVAFKQRKPVAIFSLEMSKEQLINRMFSLQSGVDAQKLRVGNLEEADWENLIEAATDIGQSNLIIDDTPSISVQTLRSKCRKFKLEHGLSMIIIDYLQLMSSSSRSESRQQEISEISRSLKEVARELNVPVLALSQLSRSVEKRDDKRPMMSDLRESGGIEQDADVIMFIYRDDYYNHDTEKKGISEIIIGKQRHGSVGTVELGWKAELTKFVNLEKRRREE